MGEGFGPDAASGFLLDGIVADGGSGAEGFIDVAGLEQAALTGGMSPDAGKAVGLEFHEDAELILRTRVALLSGANLAFDAKDGLQVVTEFVGDDISLSKVARGAKLAAEFVVKVEVNINALVGRAVEGAHGAFGSAASATDEAAEEDKPGFAVGHALLFRKKLGPGILRVVEDEADEAFEGLFFGFGIAGFASDSGCGTAGAKSEEGADQIYFEDETEQAEDEKAANAEAHAAKATEAHGAAVRAATAILNVGAFVIVIPTQSGSLQTPC